MRERTAKSIPVFLVRVVIIHTLTYFIVGMIASSLLDYRSVFELPVIRDYMVQFGETSVYWGPYIQPIRGLIIGLVLLPFRRFLANTSYGWLYLWFIMVGIGIMSTPAAAPGSIEGIVYTKLPLWYHFFGLPEMLVQTLVFSVLVHLYLCNPKGMTNALPPVFGVLLVSFAGACFAFIGYAVTSIIFSLVNNIVINNEANMSLKVQGLFIAPFVVNFVSIIYLKVARFYREVKPVIIFLIIWLTNAILIAVYQQIFLDGPDILYILIAPILPAVIVAFIASSNRAGRKYRNQYL